MRNWILACRLKTLPAALCPVALGVAMSSRFGISENFTINSICILICAILIQITTNFVNDLYDFKKGADTTNRVGPIRAVQAGLITEKQMLNGCIISTSLAILLGAYLVSQSGIPILIIGFLSILFAYLYTAGSYPLAYNGLGEIFVIIFFGPVAIWGTTFILTSLNNSDAVIAGLGLGILSSAILAANNLRDIKTDREANKKTLAVRFGLRFAKTEYIFLCLLPLLIPIFFYQKYSNYNYLFTLLYLFPAISLSKQAWQKEDSEFQIKLLENTGKLLILYTALLSYAFIF